jgi:hypothetical protein
MKIFDKEIHISKEEDKEYGKLFDFTDYDFESKWPFSSLGVTTDEEIYVLSNYFIFRYLQDKSKNRTDWDKIQDWKAYQFFKIAKNIKRGNFPKKLCDTLFILGNISSAIMIRKWIPEIKESKPVLGNLDDLIKLNRILFNHSNIMVNKLKKNE